MIRCQQICHHDDKGDAGKDGFWKDGDVPPTPAEPPPAYAMDPGTSAPAIARPDEVVRNSRRVVVLVTVNSLLSLLDLLQAKRSHDTPSQSHCPLPTSLP